MHNDKVPQINKHKHTSQPTWLNWTNIDLLGISERHALWEELKMHKEITEAIIYAKTWCRHTVRKVSFKKTKTLNKRSSNINFCPVAIPEMN